MFDAGSTLLSPARRESSSQPASVCEPSQLPQGAILRAKDLAMSPRLTCAAMRVFRLSMDGAHPSRSTPCWSVGALSPSAASKWRRGARRAEERCTHDNPIACRRRRPFWVTGSGPSQGTVAIAPSSPEGPADRQGGDSRPQTLEFMAAAAYHLAFTIKDPCLQHCDFLRAGAEVTQARTEDRYARTLSTNTLELCAITAVSIIA